MSNKKTKKLRMLIEVAAKWEKSDSKNCNCGYKGGWQIITCVGFPDVRGSYSSHDFDHTTESIKQEIIKQYTDRYNSKYDITVKLTVVKDERNPTLESFF